jgi:putative transposase
MPNHIHGLLVILGKEDQLASMLPLTGAPSGSLGAIVGNFKSMASRQVNGLRQTRGAPVWQRGYYERIVRNERELNAIRRYIEENPRRWAEDRENLDRLVARMELAR